MWLGIDIFTLWHKRGLGGVYLNCPAHLYVSQCSCSPCSFYSFEWIFSNWHTWQLIQAGVLYAMIFPVSPWCSVTWWYNKYHLQKEGVHDDIIKWRHFRITGPLCREFTSHRWIPGTKVSHAELWCFSLICVWANSCANKTDAGDLRCHRAHYDITVMGWGWV